MTVVMTQMEVLLQMSQKVKFYSKSYEIRLKLLKPDFHLRLFCVHSKKRYGIQSKHLPRKLKKNTTIPQSNIV